MVERENARVSRSFLGYEHGILTIDLALQGDGWGQSFGGYPLDGPWSEVDGKRLASPVLGHWVAGILRALECDKWESVAGSLVRVERGQDGKIAAIGHYYKDRWFRPV